MLVVVMVVMAMVLFLVIMMWTLVIPVTRHCRRGSTVILSCGVCRAPPWPHTGERVTVQDACTPPHRHRDPLICRNTTSASTTARICTPPRKPHALGNPREEGRQGHPQAPTCESQGHGEGRTYVVTLLLFTMIPRGQVCGEAVKVVVAQARDAGSTVEVRCQVLHVLVVEGEGLPKGDHRPPAEVGAEDFRSRTCTWARAISSWDLAASRRATAAARRARTSRVPRVEQSGHTN
jgi:hypothetical protein